MNLSRMKPLVAGLFLFALLGCDSKDLPHVFSGNEVPPEVMAEPRAVTVPPPAAVQNQSWMRLGDVPSMPKNFTPEDQIEQSKQQLVNDGVVAGELRQQAGMPLEPAAPKSASSPATVSARQPKTVPPVQTPVAQNNKAVNGPAAGGDLAPPQFVHSSPTQVPMGFSMTSTGLLSPYPIPPW
jgi:hypothetical protein